MDNLALEEHDDPVEFVRSGIALLPEDPASYYSQHLDLLGDVIEGLRRLSRRAILLNLAVAIAMPRLDAEHAARESAAGERALARCDQARFEFELHAIRVKKATGHFFDEWLTPKGDFR